MKLLSLNRLKNIKLVDLLSPKIVRFVWSAILDEKICPLCRDLDGQIFDANDPEYTIYQPPLHPNCRCHILSVTSDAEFIPEPNFNKPEDSSIIKYAPFLFLLPEKGKDKDKIVPIDTNFYSSEAPELFFNTQDILSIEEYIRETEMR